MLLYLSMNTYYELRRDICPPSWVLFYHFQVFLFALRAHQLISLFLRPVESLPGKFPAFNSPKSLNWERNKNITRLESFLRTSNHFNLHPVWIWGHLLAIPYLLGVFFANICAARSCKYLWPFVITWPFHIYLEFSTNICAARSCKYLWPWMLPGSN